MDKRNRKKVVNEKFSTIKYWLRHQSTVDWIVKIWSRHQKWNLLISTSQQREIAISMLSFLVENLDALPKNDVRIVSDEFQPFQINLGINALTYKLYTTIEDQSFMAISDDEEDIELNKPIACEHLENK